MAYQWERVLIETTREMEELLDWLSLLTTSDQVDFLLERRVKHGFYYEARHSPAIDTSLTSKPIVPGVERLLEISDVPAARDRIIPAITKALQFWRLLATREADNIAEPILLFYGIEALSEALVHATFSLKGSDVGAHGVRSKDGHKLAMVEPGGLFALTHAACHIDPYAVLHTTWTFEEITALNFQLYLEYQVAYSRPSPYVKAERLGSRWEAENVAVRNNDDSFYRFPEKTTKRGLHHVMLHPLDYRFITAFILSNLARYETRDWLNFLESREGFLARSFMTKTVRSYPNIFLNQFWGRLFFIGPQARLGSSQSPNLLD